MALTNEDIWNKYNESQNRFMKGLGYAGIGSAIGGGIGSLFSKNPADAANKYLNQIPGQTNQYYQPYFEAGKNALPGLQDQYAKLISDPGARLNEIGSSYHQSPGFQFALNQALGGAGRAAAAGGMAGSPQHEQQNMQLASDIGNQDYYNYLNKALGLYGQGLEGNQNLANQGQQAGGNMANLIAQQLATQGQQAYEGQAAKNQGWSDVFSTAASSLPFLFL